MSFKNGWRPSMLWDSGGSKWTSYYQKQLLALRTVRQVFKKKVENTVSVFDELSPEVKQNLINDTLKVVSIFRNWPGYFSPEQTARIGVELKNLFTATASKLAIALVKGNDWDEALPTMFTGMKAPKFLSLVIESVMKEFGGIEDGIKQEAISGSNAGNSGMQEK